jgi:hypothetical protein
VVEYPVEEEKPAAESAIIARRWLLEIVVGWTGVLLGGGCEWPVEGMVRFWFGE